MKKVLVGGVFNIVHPGHIFFLKKAKELGDYLIVVVAHNKTAEKAKKYEIIDHTIRRKNIEKLDIADKVVIGDEKDFMKVVRKEKPNIIALGYDQKIKIRDLKKKLSENNLKCDVIRIKEHLKGYKTSKIIKTKKK
ncbi:MAG: adenylyltransferase/cytidyltransferase family protein [Candidatus Aenigmatarchaeota archaeon]